MRYMGVLPFNKDANNVIPLTKNEISLTIHQVLLAVGIKEFNVDVLENWLT